MISTVAQVQNRTLALLDDSAGATFTTAIYSEGFSEAWDAMRSAQLQYQIPFITEIVEYTLPIATTVLTPATAGITGFGELVEIEERRSGSTDRYLRVWEVDKLSQRDASEMLGEFVWRLDSFQFLGATTARQLRITYWDTGAAPTSGSTGVDGAITFLSKYAAAVIAPRKGYDELGARYMLQAVGARYEEGILGGALFRLIQPMVRSMQRVQVAPMPYSVMRRRRFIRRAPYIAANPQPGSGDMPTFYSNFDGTLPGVVDGVNDFYILPVIYQNVDVSLNGSELTPGKHYVHVANSLRFLPPYIPQATDDVLVKGYSGAVVFAVPSAAGAGGAPSLAVATADPQVWDVPNRADGIIMVDRLVMIPNVDYEVVSASQIRFLILISSGSVVSYI